MTVKYNVFVRHNPNDETAPPKFYPTIKSSGRTTLRQLAEQIAEISTVSSVDTMAALEALLTVIPRELSSGNIVDLGDLGSLWLRTESTGAETAEEVTGRNIRVVRPRFNPGTKFKHTLEAIRFEKQSG